MSSRRQIMMVVAILFAALAAASAWTFLGKKSESITKGQTLVEVYVLNQQFQRLDSGELVVNSLIKKKLPLEMLPDNRITTADEAKLEELKNKVAAYNLDKGLPLTTNMLVDKAQAEPATAQRLSKDMVGVSISVDDVRGVGGNLQPGDYVNVLFNHTPLENDPKTSVDDTKLVYTTTVYQKVKILYIGNTPEAQPGQAPVEGAPVAASGVITFEVPAEAASRIVNITSGGGGGVYLVLVNPDYAPADVPSIVNSVGVNGNKVQPNYDGNANIPGKTPYANDQVPE